MPHELPTISIVTPSFNQGAFIGATLASVLDQAYPKLEYIVLDGGSTDNSVEVIKSFAPRLTRWSSEKDNGQYDAINRGLNSTSGEIMAWLNSDDLYFPWTLSVVGEIFARFPQVEWLTGGALVQLDATGRAAGCSMAEGYHAGAYMLGRNAGIPGWSTGYIQQESTFWRRGLWQRAGGFIDAQSKLAGDFDLWGRFFKAGAQPYCTTSPLAGFRRHAGQKTEVAGQRYAAEALDYLKKLGGSPASPLRRSMGGCLRRIPGAGRTWGWPGQWVLFDYARQSWELKTTWFL